MKKTNGVYKEFQVLKGTMIFTLALVLVMFWSIMSMTVNAAEQGKVTANTANVRKEATTSSDKVGSVKNGDVVTINSEVKASDGYVWYQITVGSVSGYIRSDLVQKTTNTGGTATGINPTVEVTKVQPSGASITGGDNVRVRPDASTSGSFITTVSAGTAITVTGQAAGTDGHTWYLVNFMSNGATVEGFVRSDFVTLSGELVPITGEEGNTGGESEGGNEDEEQPDVKEPEKQKVWDTVEKEDGKWYLQDYENSKEYDIEKYAESYTKNGEELIAARKSVKTQKIFIIILVVLLIGAVLLAAMLYFKVRDISDEAYFMAVEKETLRERNAMKGQQGKSVPPAGRKVMQTVGTDGNRSTRPAEAGSGVKPQAKPGVQGQVPRTAGGGQNRQVVPPATQGRPSQAPAQARPAQGSVQARPGMPANQTGNSAQSGQRPGAAAARPASAPVASGNKPVQNQPQSAPQTRKPVMDDDDEFEFEFLNWDGDEK